MWKPVEIPIKEGDQIDFMNCAEFMELTDYKEIDGKIVIDKKKSFENKVDANNVNKKKVTKRKLSQTTDIKQKKSKTDSIKRLPNNQLSTIINNDDVVDIPGMEAWKDMFIPYILQLALHRNSMLCPTPIQSLALPSAIRDKQNILGAAPTGSGKTLAFALPILTSLVNENFECNGKLFALIITPTRELALQITEHIESVCQFLPIRIASIIGGMSSEKQLRLLKSEPEIVVATPGRIWEIWNSNDYLRDCGHSLRYLVIDEADRMIEPGHFEELSLIMEKLGFDSPKDYQRQTFVYSATLTLIHNGPQRTFKKKKKNNIHRKIQDILSRLKINKKPKIIDLTVGTQSEKIQPEFLIEKRIFCNDLESRDIALYLFLQTNPGRCLIFVNSKDSVRRLRNLMDMLKLSPQVLHADMHQSQRLRHLERFASNDKAILLATDVAARGLDIKNVDYVVHYNVPRTAENYVHRSGRTARANKSGMSIIFVIHDELQRFRNILLTLKKDDLEDFDLPKSLWSLAKERVTLARKIDVEGHFIKRKQINKNWFIQAAKDADIILDDEQLVGNNFEEEHDSIEVKKRQDFLKSQLNMLLKKPLTKPIVTRYPDLVFNKIL